LELNDRELTLTFPHFVAHSNIVKVKKTPEDGGPNNLPLSSMNSEEKSHPPAFD
jgi:hypothetical protein